MFINNFSGRERRLAIATLSVVLAAAVYIFLIAPLVAGWSSLNNQVRSKIGILTNDSHILANRKALASEYSKMSKYARSGGSEEQAIADTLAYIENISRNDSCFIINIKPIGVTNTPSHKEILIDVTAEASISQFSKFLYDIENPRDVLINVKRFSLNSKASQTGVLRGTFFIAKTLLD